jgi:hypothetical protein
MVRFSFGGSLSRQHCRALAQVREEAAAFAATAGGGVRVGQLLRRDARELWPLALLLSAAQQLSHVLCAGAGAGAAVVAGSGPGGLLRGLLHSVSRSRGWVLAGAALGQGDHFLP